MNEELLSDLQQAKGTAQAITKHFDEIIGLMKEENGALSPPSADVVTGDEIQIRLMALYNLSIAKKSALDLLNTFTDDMIERILYCALSKDLKKNLLTASEKEFFASNAVKIGKLLHKLMQHAGRSGIISLVDVDSSIGDIFEIGTNAIESSDGKVIQRILYASDGWYITIYKTKGNFNSDNIPCYVYSKRMSRVWRELKSLL